MLSHAIVQKVDSILTLVLEQGVVSRRGVRRIR